MDEHATAAADPVVHVDRDEGRRIRVRRSWLVCDVHMYDPHPTTAATSTALVALRSAGTTLGAQRAARALCDAAPKSGVEGGMDFCLAQAEILLSGLLWVTHHDSRDMAAMADWVLVQDRTSPLGPGEVKAAPTTCSAPRTPTWPAERRRRLGRWRRSGRWRSEPAPACGHR